MENEEENIGPQPEVLTREVDSSKVKTNGSKWLGWVLGTVVLVGAGYGIYYLKSHPSRLRQPEAENSNVKTTTQNVSTKNWKTHENKEFGFSFQYPSNFELEEKRIDERVTIQVGKLRKSDTPVKLFDDNSFSITYPVELIDQILSTFKLTD